MNKEMRSRIESYVRAQGSCEPVAIVEVFPKEGEISVYKVTATDWKGWTVPRPPFWYVLIEPAMNLYRGDLFNDEALGHSEERDVDYIRSFHLGLMLRLTHGARRAFSQRADGHVSVVRDDKK